MQVSILGERLAFVLQQVTATRCQLVLWTWNTCKEMGGRQRGFPLSAVFSPP